MFKLQETIKEALAAARKEFKGTDEEFKANVKEKSPELIANAARIFMSSIFKFYDEHRINEIKTSYDKFLKWNEELYRDAFEMFLMFIDLTVTINTDVTEHFDLDKFPEDERLKFVQLVHLHVKGCQIANEICALLKSGYADAALARWRTLHETSVVFSVLFTNKPEVSRMFYDYQFVEKFKRVKTFQIHHGTLNWSPPDENTTIALIEKQDELIKQYGEDFTKEYGWTIRFLPKGKRNFSELETISGLSYLRPFYQWASKGVHAGPEGTFSRLGFKDINIPRGYLAGPSRYGMVDPMQFTTYSMLRMTTGVLGMVNNFENKLVLNVLGLLHEEIAKTMIEANDKLSE